jgi:hypothetical protein
VYETSDLQRADKKMNVSLPLSNSLTQCTVPFLAFTASLLRVLAFGGIDVFKGIIFFFTFWTDQIQIVELKYIMEILFLYFVRIKDDLVLMILL